MNLGEYLKNKRIESGRSLEQVAASTKIHIKILTAIEDNRYSELPARAFTRGFIVNYAKALKIDPEQLLKDHEAFLEEKFAERVQRDQGHQGYAFEGKELEQNKRWMVIGASVALVFALATLLVFKPQNHKRKEKHKEFEEETVAESDDSDQPAPTLTPGPKGELGATSSSGVPSNDTASMLLPNAINQTAIPSASSPFHPGAIASSSIAPRASSTASGPATPAATQAPTTAPTTAPTAAPSATAAPTTPPAASPSASVKADPLNKGDDLEASAVKKKISLQAKGDVWIRFKSDQRPTNIILLRKGRYLAIKATESIELQVAHPESVSYKTKGGYQEVTHLKSELSDKGALEEYSGAALGTAPIPVEIPPVR